MAENSLFRGVFWATNAGEYQRRRPRCVPSKDTLRGSMNSGNSISSSALNTSSALIICLFDSLQMSFALREVRDQRNRHGDQR